MTKAQSSSPPASSTRAHKCGHPLDPKDGGGFRPAKKSCLACVAAKLERGAAKAARRRAKKASDVDAVLPQLEAGAYRLPDGARFDVCYSASTKTWSGSLTIGTLVFTAEHSAVFKLLRKLDGLARVELRLPIWPKSLLPYQLFEQLPGRGDIV